MGGVEGGWGVVVFRLIDYVSHCFKVDLVYT